MNEKWQDMKKRCWPPKKQQLLILVLTGVLLAVIAVPVEPKEPKEKAVSKEAEESGKETESYEEQLERKLEELLAGVEGVGNVRVMLTFEGSGEKTVEKDRTVSGDEEREETVYEEYGSSERSPYVTSESNPRVEGVLVIAQGGGNGNVRQEILEAAQALFGIEAHKIKIMKMEGTN